MIPGCEKWGEGQRDSCCCCELCRKCEAIQDHGPGLYRLVKEARGVLGRPAVELIELIEKQAGGPLEEGSR